MYTPAQASEILQIATSTLRKYSRLYADCLSQQSNRQHRRYTGKDIEILKQIISLREQGISLDEIRRQLITLHEDNMQEVDNQETSLILPADKVPEYADDVRQSLDNLTEQYENLTERIRQDNRQFEETIAGLEEETRRTRRELEIIKEERDLEQSSLKQDLQKELNTILTDIQAAKDDMLHQQPVASVENPSAQNDMHTEMMQIRAELYRLKDAQKRTEQRIKSLSDRMDTPFWKRGPKNPMEA